MSVIEARNMLERSQGDNAELLSIFKELAAIEALITIAEVGERIATYLEMISTSLEKISDYYRNTDF